LSVKLPPVRSKGRSRFRKETSAASGRRHTSRPWQKGHKIDPIATLYHAWRWRRRRPEPADLKTPGFRIPQTCLQVFVLDVSDSMAATLEVMRRWMNKTLEATYVRRDPMMLIVVQGMEARVLAPPTTSVHFLLHRLSTIEEGGATPLRQGIRTVERVLRQWRDRYPAVDCFFITDGRSTEPLEGPEVKKSLSFIHRFTRDVTVINPEPRADAFARAFAELVGGRYVEAGELEF